MTQVLGVVIGLSFLFLLLSVVASGFVEVVSALLHLRAAMLERTIVALLSGGVWPTGRGGRARQAAMTEVHSAFLTDPRYRAGYPGIAGRSGRPSYLSATTFTDLVLQHYLVPGSPAPLQVDDALAAVAPDSPAAGITPVLQRIWASADRDVERFHLGVQRWYDETMDRVSGWYRRRTRWMLGIVGLVLACGLNVNVLHTAETLWTNDAARNAVLVDAAAVRAAGGSTGSANPSIGTALESYAKAGQSGLALGWADSNRPSRPGGWALSAIGWLIVALAVSLGAPFWFDTLSRLAHLRLTGAKPGEDSATRASVPTPLAVPHVPTAEGPALTTAAGATRVAFEGPERAVTGFEPARHGFHFDNDFVNRYPMLFSGGDLVTYGRCGGMVYAALDHFAAGRPIPATDQLPAQGSALSGYLLDRLVDSWASPSAIRFLTWSIKSDEVLAALTASELEVLLPQLARGRPAPLGLVAARSLADAGHNHQVLATGYDREPDGTVRVHIYDNNSHDQNVVLTIRPDRPGIRASNRLESWRGLFVHTYRRATPPDQLD